jgi:hypothetical protein
MAAKVMRMPDEAVEQPIQRQAQEEKEQLQMQPLEAIQAKSSSGEPQEKEEQNQESVQTKLTVGAPGDKYEQEADSMATKVMRCQTQPSSSQFNARLKTKKRNSRCSQRRKFRPRVVKANPKKKKSKTRN